MAVIGIKLAAIGYMVQVAQALYSLDFSKAQNSMYFPVVL